MGLESSWQVFNRMLNFVHSSPSCAVSKCQELLKTGSIAKARGKDKFLRDKHNGPYSALKWIYPFSSPIPKPKDWFDYEYLSLFKAKHFASLSDSEPFIIKSFLNLGNLKNILFLLYNRNESQHFMLLDELLYLCVCQCDESTAQMFQTTLVLHKHSKKPVQFLQILNCTRSKACKINTAHDIEIRKMPIKISKCWYEVS